MTLVHRRLQGASTKSTCENVAWFPGMNDRDPPLFQGNISNWG